MVKILVLVLDALFGLLLLRIACEPETNKDARIIEVSIAFLELLNILVLLG